MITKRALIDSKPVLLKVRWPIIRWKGHKPAAQFDAEIWCPYCNRLHVDTGDYARDLHHTHLCLKCGQLFRVEATTILSNRVDPSGYFTGVKAFTWRGRLRTVRHLLADVLNLVLS